MARACLASISPLDIDTGERVTLYACSMNDRRVTGLGGQVWEPAIAGEPSLELKLWNGDFLFPVDTGNASLPLNMDVIKESWPDADRYMWPSAPITIYAEEPGTIWPWKHRFKGVVNDISRKGQVLTLGAQIDTESFNKQVLTLEYQGTGLSEGGEDLKNRAKPLVLGWAKNVEPVLINANDSVYQFSAYGAIEEVTTLYERGSDFGSSVGNYGSYSSLVGASIPAGRWATCLNEGLIRLGAPAYGVITGDIKGHEVAGETPRLTGAVISALAAIAQVDAGLLHSATLDAMDQGAPYPINIVLTQQVTFPEVARRLALACNYQSGIGLDGKFFVAPVSLEPSPVLVLEAKGRRQPQVKDSVELSVSVPYTKTIMGAARCWRVHSADEIAFWAPIVEKGLYNGSTVYREGNIVSLEDGSRYIYINTTPSSGNSPPNATYWGQLSGAIGEQGNLIFRKAASKPSTPSPSSGVPSGWVDEISSVGSSDLPIWASYGKKASGSSTYTWQSPYAVAADERLWDAVDTNGGIKDDKVDTPAVVDDAISETPYAYNGSSKSLSTSMVLVLDLTLPADVAGKEQIFSGLLDAAAPTFEGSELSFKMTVRRCNYASPGSYTTIISDRRFANFNDEGSASGVMGNFTFRDTPDATFRRYQIYFAITDSSTLSASTSSFIAAEGLKK